MNPEKKVEIALGKFGARLRYFRKLKGYTNYEHFAYEVDISRSQYGKYENGGNIKLTTLIKILDFMDVTLAEFFSEGFDYAE
jgi:transcriptional regulator with XRE-family HTH domain